MEKQGIIYRFCANIWCSEWYFVSLPKEMSKEIRQDFKRFEEGWGRLKATAKIGDSEWKTAIWFDTKQQVYLLPIKGEIRKRERIGTDHAVQVTLWI